MDGQSPQPSQSHEMEIRVRYQETDGQRRVHHANFLTYFEMGTLAAFWLFQKASCKYRASAEYDDLLLLRTWVEKVGGASIEHGYEVIRGKTILATGKTIVVCVDRAGKVQRLPDWLLN